MTAYYLIDLRLLNSYTMQQGFSYRFKLLIMKTFTLFSIASLLFISCDRPECTNINPVFEANLPESSEYKTELATRLDKNSNNLTYWFDRYEEKDSRQYIHAFVQGDSLCAKAVILLQNPNEKLDGIIKAKGGGYHGAELDGLEFATVKKAGETIFVYKNLNRIID